MFALTKLTREYFKLIRNAFHFIPQSTKIFIIHLCLFQYLDEFLIGHEVKDRILHRFDLIRGPFSRYKIQVENFRFVTF